MASPELIASVLLCAVVATITVSVHFLHWWIMETSSIEKLKFFEMADNCIGKFIKSTIYTELAIRTLAIRASIVFALPPAGLTLILITQMLTFAGDLYNYRNCVAKYLND